MRIREIMRSITKVHSNMCISRAAKLMDQKSIGSVLIEEEGEVIGIMTERDILRKVVAKGKNPYELKAKDIMNCPIITIDANEDILEASRKIEQYKIRRMIITENNEIVGIVTANDIAKNLKFILIRESPVYTRVEY